MKQWNNWIIKNGLGWMLGWSICSVHANTVQSIEGGPQLNGIGIQPAASKIAEQIHGLNNMILLVCLAIAIIVFGVMIYSMVKFRKSKGAKPVDFQGPTIVRILGKDRVITPEGLEIAWTIVPFIIVIAIALPATKTMVAMKDTSNADLTIKVTGYQWKWGYDYLSGSAQGVSLISTLATPREQINNQAPKENDYLLRTDNPLVVPVGKKIRIVTTAADVIHGWMVPQFGIKIDAIPGVVRDAWFKADKIGMYYGQCVELCGKEHAFMPINVKVVSLEDFEAWAESKRKEMAAQADDPTKTYTMDELVSRGQKVYDANCVSCHQANGMGLAAFKKLNGSPVVLGPKADQMRILLEGKNQMPAWSALTDVQLASVMTFTRNHWDNKTGELIQPSEFTAARAGKFPVGGGVGAGASPQASQTAAPSPDATGSAPITDGGQTDSSGVGEISVYKVFFEVGSSGLSAESKAELDKVVEQSKANNQKKIIISGFVDATGDPRKNEILAKDRAIAVKDYLVSRSVSEERLEMKKPEAITNGSTNAESRRVEVKIGG